MAALKVHGLHFADGIMVCHHVIAVVDDGGRWKGGVRAVPQDPAERRICFERRFSYPDP